MRHPEPGAIAGGDAQHDDLMQHGWQRGPWRTIWTIPRAPRTPELTDSEAG